MTLLGPPPKIVIPDVYGNCVETRYLDYIHNFNDEQLIMPMQLCSVWFSHLNLDEQGQPASIKAGLAIRTPGLVERYVQMRGLISVCVTSAEDVNRALHRLDQWMEFTAEATSKGKKPADFMNMKSAFVDYARKNPATRALISKELSTAFNNFILYRNIFTHGKLMLSMPSGEFCIQYHDNTTKEEAYMIVTKELLATFYNTYHAFQRAIDDVSNTPHIPTV